MWDYKWLVEDLICPWIRPDAYIIRASTIVPKKALGTSMSFSSGYIKLGVYL